MLMLASLCLFGVGFYFQFKRLQWTFYGKGKLDAHAKYGRLQREQPGSVAVSEAEFVKEFLKSKGPSVKRPLLLFGLGFLCLFASCTAPFFLAAMLHH